MKSYLTLKEAFLDTANAENQITVIEKDGYIREMTYETLQARAKKCAAYFSEKTIRKGDKVVLAVSDISLFLSAFWGLVLIGAVAVPVTPPQSGVYLEGKQDTLRLLNIIKILSPVRIVTGTEEFESLHNVMEDSGNVLEISENIIGAASDAHFFENVSENDLALILFTSGSTGVPKGVEITHKKALEGCYQNIERFHFTPESTLMNWLPLEHIASLMLFHLLPLILKSNQVQVYTSEILSDAKKFLRYLDTYHVQASFAPNFLYRMLLEQKDDIAHMHLSLNHVNVIINGGESINYHTTDACVKILEEKGFPSSAMIPGWGMTEIGNGAVYSNNFGKVMYGDYVAIGKPVKGLSVRVVKENQIITEEDTEGVLEIKGSFILSNYLNETPEEHAERFTKDGWFRTGDLVVWKSGELVITGRESEILILNGVNISLNEIESHIRNTLPNVQGILKALAVRNHETNADELYIFAEQKEIPDEEQFASGIRKCVTERYGFPVGQIVFVPENQFPKTSIGKIDSKTLVKNMRNQKYTFASVPVHHKTNTSELSDEEYLLIFIWAEALGLDKDSISVDDDFFSIGGDSSKVPNVLEKINASFGSHLNAAQFVEYSTIQKLLNYLHTDDDSNDDDEEEIIIL